jgi:hypothetical protein
VTVCIYTAFPDILSEHVPFALDKCTYVGRGMLYDRVEEVVTIVKEKTEWHERLRSPGIDASQFYFWAERDGAVERLLKNELRKLFIGDKRISVAYLAQSSIGPPNTVTLCLVTLMGPGWCLNRRIRKIFAKICGADTSLDINLRLLSRICG